MPPQPLQIPLYPLTFEPIYQPKIWGGRRIASLGRTLPGGEDHPIGESWELVDLNATGTTDAAAQPARSAIAGGPLKGTTLHDAMAAFGERLMGDVRPDEAGQFPLLIKLLDARENLSVQVHPSPAYAAAHPAAHVKSEAWYIIDADPDAVIYKGLRPGVTPQALRGAAERGDEAALLDMLNRVPVKPGECHYLPSGTLHALGAGILVAEVQTASDTTFRVHDWGRSRLSAQEQRHHLEQAMQCIDFTGQTALAARRAQARSHVAGFFTTVTRLVRCEHFQIEKVRMTEGYEQEIPYDQPAIWIVLEGGGRITRAHADPVGFTRGQTLLIPAHMNDARLALARDTVWLEVTFPSAAPAL
jgi:mannose-6-phosphate isomerase